MNAATISVGWLVALLVASAQLVTSRERRRVEVRLRIVETIPSRRRATARVLAQARALPVVRKSLNVVALYKSRRSQRRRAAVSRAELPATLDLIAVGVGSGASLLQSIVLAEKWAHPDMQAELASVLRRVDMGALLHDSLMYPSDSPPDVRAVFDALALAVALGTALQPTLLRLSGEARTRDARSAATHARTIPVRLIFPLVLLVLPAFVLLTVVPALVAGWRGF